MNHIQLFLDLFVKWTNSIPILMEQATVDQLEQDVNFSKEKNCRTLQDVNFSKAFEFL